MQRPVHRGGADLAMPTPNRARKSVKALTASPERKTNAEKTDGRRGDDRRRAGSGRPASPSAARPSTRNAPDAGGDEDDHAVADAEGVADVRREHAEGRALEVLDAVEEEQHDEGEAPADRAGPPCRVSSSSPTPGSRSSAKRTSWSAVGGLPLGLGVEDRVGERRGLGHLVGSAHMDPPLAVATDIMLPLVPAVLCGGQNQVLAILERTFQHVPEDTSMTANVSMLNGRSAHILGRGCPPWPALISPR